MLLLCVDDDNNNCRRFSILNVAIRNSALAPFQVRSFRFQWPADIATSWAFEMETLILGWYVLVETGSVLLLTVFASLRYLGTLLAPLFGVAGDRAGQRTVLCAMRAFYAAQAITLMTLAFTGTLSPAYVFAIAAMMGLVQPSDIGMRAALIGDTMPPAHLMSAMGIQRTTQDSAKIAGSLTGAGLVAALGIGSAYAVVACLYATSVVLTLKARSTRSATPPREKPHRASPLRELKEGLAYVRRTPQLLALMLLAFLLNLTAFPLFTGLLPYVAKEIYDTDRTGLGYMVASTAFGALVGSIALSRHSGVFHPARMMVVACVMWYTALFVFAHIHHPYGGMAALVFAGFAQSMGQVPMSALLLRACDEQFRGRVMGIRMLAIYGNLPGLLIAGPLISVIGYPWTATLYCVLGIAFTIVIARRWRSELWKHDAAANRR